jgi:hypothetical protein
MRIPKIMPIVAVAITFFSCWSPIYDERISASAKLSQKLDSLAIKRSAVGPVDWSMGNSDSAYEFLPSKYNDLDTGILVARGEGDFSIRYFGKQDATNPATISGYGTSGAEGFSERTVLISAAVTEKYAARPVFLGLNGNPSTRARDIRLCYRDPTFVPTSTELYESGTTISFTGIPTMSYLVAAGAVLNADGIADNFEFLYFDSISNYVRVGAVYDFPTATYPDGNTPMPVAGIGMTIDKGSRFFRLNNDFFLSAYSSSTGAESIHCYRWIDSGAGSASTLAAQPVALPSITAPVVGILSNEGVILAQDTLFLYAFTKDGTELFRVPAGNLRFMQEFTVDGYPCAIFTQVIVTKLNYQNKFAAKTWAVRSDAVISIGN